MATPPKNADQPPKELEQVVKRLIDMPPDPRTGPRKSKKDKPKKPAK